LSGSILPPTRQDAMVSVYAVRDPVTYQATSGHSTAATHDDARAVAMARYSPQLTGSRSRERHRSHAATALFVPAWDFGDDAWLHSRMAITRGVENGMSIARAARQGALTVSDPYGRVIAEGRTAGASMVTVTARLPSGASSTLYTHLGDWFAWVCVILVLAGVVVAYCGRPGASRRPGMGSRGAL